VELDGLEAGEKVQAEGAFGSRPGRHRADSDDQIAYWLILNLQIVEQEAIDCVRDRVEASKSRELASGAGAQRSPGQRPGGSPWVISSAMRCRS
jgi:hypothetical protein